MLRARKWEGRTLAFARTEGGMILSGPKAWRGSMKEVRILPHFLHSAVDGQHRLEGPGCGHARQSESSRPR